MRYFSSIFAVIGIAILMVELALFNNQHEIMRRDFDTDRLAAAIEYAEESAFAQSLQSGTISTDYTDIGGVVCDPTNTLDVFSAVMCANYNMAITGSNKQMILNSIDAACLINNDGYYIALLSEVYTESADSSTDIGNIEYKFKWSPKLPFGYEIDSPVNATIGFDLHSSDLNIYDHDTDNVYLSKGSESKVVWYEDVIVNGGTYKIQRTDTEGIYSYMKDGVSKVFASDVINDKIKYRVINDKIANALNYNISVVAEKRGGTTYNVHLPASTTADGVNPVLGNSLIVVISNAEYARKANLTEAVISGHRATNKLYIVGFEEDGIKYYCKNGQLPMDENGNIPTKPNGTPLYIVETKFLTEGEAAASGYHPHYTYLQIPLKRE